MRARGALLLGALAAGAACSDLSIESAVERIISPIANPSFRNDIAPILDETCASSGACHGGPAPQKGLNLTADSAYANVVNQLTQCCGLLVIPGDSVNSFLPRVMSTDINVRRGYQYRMPLTEFPMPAAVVETIKIWIADGAADN